MLKKSKRSNRQNYSNSKKGLPKWRFSNKQHTSHLRATWINIKIQACSTMNIQSTCSIWLRKLKTIPHLSRQLHSNIQVVRANLIAMMKKKHRAHPGDLRLQCRATIQAGKTHISQESTRMTWSTSPAATSPNLKLTWAPNTEIRHSTKGMRLSKTSRISSSMTMVKKNLFSCSRHSSGTLTRVEDSSTSAQRTLLFRTWTTTISDTVKSSLDYL